jgi:hypothetical protein
MPNSTDISCKPSTGTLLPPSPPSGGEGQTERSDVRERGTERSVESFVHCLGRSSPSPSLAAPAYPSPPEGGEGGLAPILAKRDQDGPQDAFGIGYDVIVGETDHAEAFAFHICGSISIINFLPGMAISIQLNDETLAPRRKVSHVEGAKDHLADEFDAFQPASAKKRPEFGFWWRHLGAQAFCVGSVGDVAFGHLIAPSPWRRSASPVPLPLKGVREAHLSNIYTLNKIGSPEHA